MFTFTKKGTDTELYALQAKIAREYAKMELGDYTIEIKGEQPAKTHHQLKAWYRGVNLALAFMQENESNPMLELCGQRVEFPLTKDGVDMFLKVRVALPVLGHIPSKSDMKKDEFVNVLNRLDDWLKKYMDVDLFERNENA